MSFQEALSNYHILNVERTRGNWSALVVQRYAPFGYFHAEGPTLVLLRRRIHETIADLERPIGASENWYQSKGDRWTSTSG